MEIFKSVKSEASKEFEKLLDTQFSKTQSLVEGKIIEGVITKITEAGCEAILVGPVFKKYNRSDFIVFEKVEELIESNILKKFKNFKVLIKGSRSIQLEKIEAYL